MAPQEVCGQNNNPEAGNLRKQVKIGKMNIDESMNTVGQYEVMSIPTIIFFKDGQIVARMVGMKSKGDLEAKIKELK